MGCFDTNHFQLGKESSQLYYSFSVWVILTTLVKSVVAEVSRDMEGKKKEEKLSLFVFTLCTMALDFGQFLETFPPVCFLKTCCFLFPFFQTLGKVSIAFEWC